MRKLAVVLATLLLLFGTAGCGGGSESGSSTDDSGSVDADAPEAEDPGAEEAPDSSGADAVAVDLPGLPIGGQFEPTSSTVQCVDVVWSGPPEVPDGIGITITGVALPEGYAQSSESCPSGTQSCLGGGFQLTNDGNCSVAVAFTGEPIGAEPSMSFSSGRINCPPNRVEQCQDFKAEVESSGPQPIELLEPDPGSGTGESGTGESETGDSEEDGETDSTQPDSTQPDSTEESDSTDDGGG
jgi:hypothetical protein